MNFEQIQQLLTAGFTPDQIMQLQGGLSAQAAPAQPEPTPAQPETQPAQPEAQPAQKPAETPAASSQAGGDDAYQRLEAKLNQLIGLQTQSNINANIGSAQPARSATDILAGVIAPPRREGRQEGNTKK